MKPTNENTEKLLQRYERSPTIRGLIQLIPCSIGGAIDAALEATLLNIREKRLRIFFDELGSGKIALSPELLKSEDFLHCFFATKKAALNSRREEKIRMFARLLKSYTLPNSFSGTDEYEEYLQILDELSCRELLILSVLEKYESQFPREDKENDLQRTYRFWDKFTREINELLSITANEINSILTRLNRTGCYGVFIGTYFGYEGDKGKLTQTYFRLKKLIETEADQA